MTSRIAKIIALCIGIIIIAGVTVYFTLTFFITKEQTVLVPNLLGKDIVSSLEILSDLGLNTKIRGSEYSDKIAVDHVIFQNPKPGTEIKKGREIGLIVSKGHHTFTMPDLEGLSIDQARIIIEKNSLSQGALSYTSSISIPKDHLIAQIPLPGNSIDHGKSVDLLISSGPQLKAYSMPNLADLSLSEAIMLIEGKNLRVGQIKSFYIQTKPEYVVINQNPLYGHRVEEGRYVDLVINKKTGIKKQDISNNSTEMTLFIYRTEPGFLKTHIKVELKKSGVSEELFNNYVQSGEDIWLLVETGQDTFLLVYKNDQLVKVHSF